MDELLSEFLTESFENLSLLDVELVKLEQTPDDPELLSSIFRTVHTIKGTCGFLGLPRLERVAHGGENVLGRIRDGEIVVTPEAITLVLRALDRIKFLLEQLEATQQEPAGTDEDLTEALDVVAAGGTPTLPVAGMPKDQDEDAPPPDAAAVDEETTAPGSPKAPSEPPASTGPAPEAPAGGSVTAQSLRVSVELLENLLTLVSELVLTRNQLLQTSREHGDGPFKAPLQRLSHITSELQEGVMKTRMQPIGNAWSKLPRLIRDLARDLDKTIELKLIGADTELDRQVLELIKDPLTHMVRNSADHGIEPPAVRRELGKPEHGTITLSASHEGGQIIIDVADDGRGLDADRIAKKALAQGMCTAEELAGLSEAQIFGFVFRPGFSTAAAVSNVSGRGVGMDVVKTNIEKIGGSLELGSRLGHGTTFKIKIPLTLAIVPALIIEAGGERFAIPQTAVVELVRAGKGREHRIEIIDGAPILRLRERLLPLLRLSSLLGLDDGLASFDHAYVVVSQVGNARFGLVVDRVFDTEEIVVKPMAPILRNLSCFAGNTILGDGAVVMILDLNSLTEHLANGSADAATCAVAGAARLSESTSLLLFRAGERTPKAVPLGLVTRLEEIDLADVECSCGRAVVQYRGELMPLTDIDGGTVLPARGRRPVLVFTDSGNNLGLVVDEIVDIAADVVDVKVKAAGAGIIGSTVVAGRSTDIIDVAYFVQTVFGGWFHAPDEPYQAPATAPRKVLVVDDSRFFRNLLGPILEASGYHVTRTDSALKALELRDRGHRFDVVITDIEMPEMDGFAFAAAIRRDGPWRNVPVIALTSHTAARDVERGREVGFADYVGKLDREALLVAISRSIALEEAA